MNGRRARAARAKVYGGLALRQRPEDRGDLRGQAAAGIPDGEGSQEAPAGQGARGKEGGLMLTRTIVLWMLGMALTIAFLCWWVPYRYADCRKVGHSKTYCVMEAFK